MALLGSAFLAYSSSVLAEDSSYGYSDSDPVYGNSTYGFGTEKQGGIDDSDKEREEKIERIVRAKDFEQQKLLELRDQVNQKDLTTMASNQLIAQKYIEQEKKAGRYNAETQKIADQIMSRTKQGIAKYQKNHKEAQDAIKDYQEHREEHLEEYRQQIEDSLVDGKGKKEKQSDSFFYGE